MKIFLSHPYSSCGTVEENIESNEKYIKELQQQRPGAVIISPIKLFGHMKKETPAQRIEIMEICFALIDECDAFAIPEDAAKISDGCNEELDYAFDRTIEHIFLEPIGIKEKNKTPLDLMMKEWELDYGELFKVEINGDMYMCTLDKEDGLFIDYVPNNKQCYEYYDESELFECIMTGKAKIVGKG